jgi:hypothetical protein
MLSILQYLAPLSEYMIERMAYFPRFGFSFSWTCFTKRAIYPTNLNPKSSSITLLTKVLDAIVVVGTASTECSVLE